MKIASICVCCVLLACGCQTTRSISHYQHGYNPSYRGELSQVEFIKDVSTGERHGPSAPIRIAKGDRVIVMQSGQIRPDTSFLNNLSEHCNVVPMSGVPSQHTVGGLSLREAAKAGSVDKIVAYWGSIETSISPKGTKVVSWVPVAGWFIPDESQKMRVSVSAIVADVSAGRWVDVSAVSDETYISQSLVNSRTGDSQQAEALKAQAYQRLGMLLTEHL